MVGTAIVLDFSSLPEFHEVTTKELVDKIGTLKGDILLFNFGWDKHLGTADYYIKHPYLSEDACSFIVDQGYKLIALDTPQPDNPLNGRNSKTDAPNHKILLGNDVLIAEYLVNINKIVGSTCTLFAVPIKIKDGDGAPIRCFAIEE